MYSTTDKTIAVSSEKVPKNAETTTKTNGATPGISIRNGPVEEMEIDTPVNGHTNGKRKARASLRGSISKQKSYKEATSDDDDDEPLVILVPLV
jgi:DNA topoisomerase I